MNPYATPQPLTGTEIKRGIAVRMTHGLPADVAETLREKIIEGLGKTCSLLPSSAYAKFKATWTMVWWREGGEIHSDWWVKYDLDDFGRVTSGGIGERPGNIPMDAPKGLSGTIEEVPPDRFRRETDQPIPKPTELKPQEQDKSTFSKSIRGSGKRREV